MKSHRPLNITDSVFGYPSKLDRKAQLLKILHTCINQAGSNLEVSFLLASLVQEGTIASYWGRKVIMYYPTVNTGSSSSNWPDKHTYDMKIDLPLGSRPWP